MQAEVEMDDQNLMHTETIQLEGKKGAIRYKDWYYMYKDISNPTHRNLLCITHDKPEWWW